MEQSAVSAMTLVVRSNDASLALGRELRRIVSEIDKDQAVTEVKTLDGVVSDASARWRVSAVLFAIFGGAAVAMALIGVYGAVSYAVAQRKIEIAIRIALGSSYSAIIRMIFRYVAALGWISAALGLLAAATAGHGIRALLYGIEPLDSIVSISGLLATFKVVRISPSLAPKSE